jgi:hypothetical protein
MGWWCGAVGLFGLVLAGGAFDATDGVVELLYTEMGGATVEWTPVLRFATALMGCVSIGWALTLVAVLRASDALGIRAAPVWRATTLAILVWFVTDSALSVATGFALNAASNALLLAGYLLAVTRSGVLRAA